MPKMPVLLFDRWPYITDLVRDGGQPGFEYFIVAGVNCPGALSGALDGTRYQTTEDDPHAVTSFDIEGERGTVSCILMRHGKVIQGINRGSVHCRLKVDPTVAELTGLPLTPRFDPPTVGLDALKEHAPYAAGGNKPGPKGPRTASVTPAQVEGLKSGPSFPPAA